ncbi:MAG: type II toxin-antitoxin system HicA family toxin [Verrucomicrobiae bacterium]|nr:type II toxin-antitoxin system HicA family toxin [Verrucomicrobiae bacterium]MCP5550246.1 type II toxin-antitoxin system HicA family toxin [Akkermansiaceae bacterium]
MFARISPATCRRPISGSCGSCWGRRRSNDRAEFCSQKPARHDIGKRYHGYVNNRQRKILEAIFEDPVRSNISWAEIESLLRTCGAEISEGRGSRVRFALNGVRAVFHRPHPSPDTDRGAVRSMRRFLTEAGIKP